MEDYDINELIELAKSKPSTLEEKIEAMKEPTEAHRFCMSKGIGAGTNKTPFKAIYYLYKQWTNEPVGEIAFGKQLSKLFKRVRDAQGSYYMLDASSINEALLGKKEEVKENAP